MFEQVEIHPTAIVAKGAQLGPGTVVGPYSIVGAKVVTGSGNIIGPHVVIEGNTTLGDGNRIFQFASLGSAPQDLKFRGEDSQLIVGDGNTIREYVTLQPGTEGGGMVSRVGSRNLFMVSSHLGHDGVVGDENVFANCCALAGHVVIGNRTILGGLTAVHQFVRVGDFAMIAGGSMVTQDIPPFCMAQGDRARLIGINAIGMERAGFASGDIAKTKKAFRMMFMRKGVLSDLTARAREELGDCAPAMKIIDFAQSSERGIAARRKND